MRLGRNDRRSSGVHKELLDKYVYLGLSRARSFLGATYERQFPTRLKAIAHHVVDGTGGEPTPAPSSYAGKPAGNAALRWRPTFFAAQFGGY